MCVSLKCVFCSTRIDVNVSVSFLLFDFIFFVSCTALLPHHCLCLDTLLEHQTIINIFDQLMLISHSFHASMLENSLGQRPNGTTIHANGIMVENPHLLLDSPASGLTAVRVCINIDAVRRPEGLTFQGTWRQQRPK